MKIFSDIHKKRLICVNNGVSPEYWDEFWKEREVINPIRTSKEFVKITKKYLENGSTILEGGCGLGDKVKGLHEEGYDVIGIDYAEMTVKDAKQRFPELNIQKGDVRNLKFKDESFDGYWSLGVIEHFWNGYDEIIDEAYRVLKKGGYLFLTFPSMSVLRKYRYQNEQYSKLNSKKVHEPIGFYQFILNSNDVKTDLIKTGFQIVSLRRRSGMKGFTDSFPIITKHIQRLDSILHRKLVSGILYLFGLILQSIIGHGTIIVARKL